MSTQLAQKFEAIDEYFYAIMIEVDQELSNNFFVNEVRNISWGDTLFRYSNDRTLWVLEVIVPLSEGIDFTTPTLNIDEQMTINKAVKEYIHRFISETLFNCNLVGTPFSFQNTMDVIFEGVSICTSTSSTSMNLSFKMNAHIN